MDDVTKTEKMLSRKDGAVGYVIFNNPERHNAVSLEMWAATARILEAFARDDEVRVVVGTGAGGKTRAWLLLPRAATAGGRRRSCLCARNPVHGPAVRCRGGAHHGTRQPRGPGRGARKLHRRLYATHLRQRAANVAGGEIHHRRNGEGREQAQPGALQ